MPGGKYADIKDSYAEGKKVMQGKYKDTERNVEIQVSYPLVCSFPG
jgi:hypothetical protein